jgi:hypothetical protein
MQVFCTTCGREQYPPLISAISQGEEPCLYCDVIPPALTVAEYRALCGKEQATSPSSVPALTASQNPRKRAPSYGPLLHPVHNVNS